MHHAHRARQDDEERAARLRLDALAHDDRVARVLDELRRLEQSLELLWLEVRKVGHAAQAREEGLAHHRGVVVVPLEMLLRVRRLGRRA